MGDPYDNVFRKAIVAGLGVVPEVGPFLSFFADVLLPNGAASDPVADLKAQIEKLRGQLLDDWWIERLKTNLEGLTYQLTNMNDPNKASDHEKAYWDLYDKSGLCAQDFLNPTSIGPTNDDQPQNTVSLLVAYGTLRLAVLRDWAYNYKTINGSDPTSRDTLIQDLVQTYAALRDKVTTDRARAINWRLGQVTISYRKDQPPPLIEGPSSSMQQQQEFWTVADAQDSSFSRQFTNNDQAQRYCSNRQWTVLLQMMAGQASLIKCWTPHASGSICRMTAACSPRQDCIASGATGSPMA